MPHDDRIFGREGVRGLDAAARDEFGLPTIVLMENAAAALERACVSLLGEMGAAAPVPRPDRRAGSDRGASRGGVMILAGPGNNGGDGLALARRLDNAGVRVAVALSHPPERAAGDARINLGVAQRMGIAVRAVDDPDIESSLGAMLAALAAPVLFVDALLGTGADRPLAPPIEPMARWLNRARAAAPGSRTLAVDIPTGLDCDTGLPLAPSGPVVRADVTLTFAGVKRGFLNPRSREFTGEVIVGDIGVPRALLDRFADHSGREGAAGETPAPLKRNQSP